MVLFWPGPSLHMCSTPMPEDGKNIVGKLFRVRVGVKIRRSYPHYEIVSS